MQIASGYGLPATRITTGEELARALADANSAEGLRLLEVPIIAETRALG